MKFHATELLLPIDDQNKVNIQTKGKTKREISIIFFTFHLHLVCDIFQIIQWNLSLKTEHLSNKL